MPGTSARPTAYLWAEYTPFGQSQLGARRLADKAFRSIPPTPSRESHKTRSPAPHPRGGWSRGCNTARTADPSPASTTPRPPRATVASACSPRRTPAPAPSRNRARKSSVRPPSSAPFPNGWDFPAQRKSPGDLHDSPQPFARPAQPPRRPVARERSPMVEGQESERWNRS